MTNVKSDEASGRTIACADACTGASTQALQNNDVKEMRDIIEAFLSLDHWEDEAIAPKELIARARTVATQPTSIPVIVAMEGGLVQDTYCPNPEITVQATIIDYGLLRDGDYDCLRELLGSLEEADGLEKQYLGRSSFGEELAKVKALLQEIESTTGQGDV